jgi:hypothetical protein
MKNGIILCWAGCSIMIISIILNNGGYPTTNCWFTSTIVFGLIIGVIGFLVGLANIAN